MSYVKLRVNAGLESTWKRLEPNEVSRTALSREQCYLDSLGEMVMTCAALLVAS